jgi:hypothetical protein
MSPRRSQGFGLATRLGGLEKAVWQLHTERRLTQDAVARLYSSEHFS